MQSRKTKCPFMTYMTSGKKWRNNAIKRTRAADEKREIDPFQRISTIHPAAPFFI